MFLVGSRNNFCIIRASSIWRVCCVFSAFLLIILSIGIFIPFSYTEERVDAITDLTGDPSVTMTSTKNTASVTIDPSSTGVFATTSGNGDIVFSVSTTNYTGYELYVHSTTTTLDKGASSILSLASGVTAEQFSNGSNTTLNNRWGYKPSFYNSVANNKYYGSSTSAVVLDRTSAANTTAKSYTISLGARADDTIPSGSYTNDNFILETVANVVPSSILTVDYGTGVTGVTVGGSTIADGETVKLIQGVPYTINMTYDTSLYTFSSWSATAGTIGSASTQSTTYTISTSNATLTANVQTIGPEMQNLDTAECTTTARLVKDNRDNHTYTIQRLADGNCWMMENLDLGRTTLTTDLTSSNTNLSTTVTASTFNGWKKTSGTENYTDGEFISVDGSDAVSGTAYGTFYNYYAVSAGTISGSSNANNATYDICPAGWRLPTGGSSGEFQALYAQYNSPALMRASIGNNGAAFALAGFFNSYYPTPSYQGRDGHYWTSTRYNNASMYYLFIDTSNVDPVNAHERHCGYPIRCVLKKSITDFNYLQDFKDISVEDRASVIASMANNTSYSLIDNRDNKTYHIAKHRGDIVWMVENLDLGRTTLTTNLTSSNTNLSNSVTASTFNGWKKTSGTATYTAGEFINLSGTDSTSGTQYGTLYNYYAASAGTITGNTSSTNAIYDICPAGWRLPSGGDSGEFKSFYSNYNYNSIMRAPIEDGGVAFTLAGRFYNGTPELQGSSGYCWSSTRLSDPSSYYLYLNSSRFDTANGTTRNYGYSVRCTLKKPTHSLTITFGSNISSVTIDGDSVTSGSVINFEEGIPHTFEATPANGYSVSWHASSGTISSASSATMDYVIGTGNVTITATATFDGPNLQNLSSTACTTTASYAKDTRDDHVYTIQRLADGNCWMMENLDLGRTTLSSSLTSSNTNLSTTVTAITFNSWKKTSSSQSFTSGEFINVSGTDSTSGTAYGTLYNYYVASAGTITGSSNSKNGSYDICPAGWRLPTSGSSGEFQALYTQYNSAALMRAGVTNNGAAFALSGSFYGSGPLYQDNFGFYWSSTIDDDTSMHGLYIASSVTPSNSGYRGNGGAIRCILKKPSHTLTVSYGTGVADVTINGVSIANGGTISLEEGLPVSIDATIINSSFTFASWSATSGTIGSVSTKATTYTISTSDATLAVAINFDGPNLQHLAGSACTETPSYAKDNRDGHIYAIQRLQDGRCWMMENLDLGRTSLTTDLTSSNTNLATTITASTFNGWKKTTGTSTNTSGVYVSVSGTDATAGTAYGTLYNYCAASAGSICTSSNSGDAQFDICPAGWRIPTGGSNSTTSEYQALYSKYNSASRMRASIANNGAAFALSGYFASNNTYTGTYGWYWTSTYYSSANMYRFDVRSSSVSTSQTYSRTNGLAIRCISKDEVTISHLTYLQDFDLLSSSEKASVLASMDYDTTYNLIDNRDNKTYKVARLKDDNIWMVENLDLGRTTLSTDLTRANTNVINTVAASTFNSWKKTSGTGTMAAGEFISVSGTDSASGSPYGTLYNYHAASAGTITGSTINTDAEYDICPAGWRLPTGGSSGEFQTLYSNSAYNTNVKMRAPITSGGAAFALSGYFTSGAAGNQGVNSSYWSSTMSSAIYMHYLRLGTGTSDVYPADSGWRSYGISIRCIAKGPKTIDDYVYLQDFKDIPKDDKTAVLASMEESTIYNLIDNRDGKSYAIAKLKDGKVWMTKNLDLGRTTLTTDLTSDNTNLSVTVTASTFNSWKKTTGTSSYTVGEFIPLSTSNTSNGLDTDPTSGTPYGTLYNYYVASAGTITGSSNSSNASYDICPAGWRLPTGGSSGDFSFLLNKYSRLVDMRGPIEDGGAALTFAGYFYAGNPTSQNSYGYFWASNRSNTTSMYAPNFSSSGGYASNTSVRYRGCSIRCILQ